MSSLKDVVINPMKILSWIVGETPFLRSCLSNKVYLKIKYRGVFGKKLDLNNPKTFNEKLQWLKIYGDYENLEKWVDKYEIKEILGKIFGRQYVIPNLGIWNSFDEIDFDMLPKQFVLKCTHDSGGVVVCKDKDSFDYNNAKKIIEQSMKRNFFFVGREKPYKNVRPRILAEKFMVDESGELIDYKVHNFNGVPKFVLVCSERFAKSGLKEDFYDVEWNHLDVARVSHPNALSKMPCPRTMSQMLDFSRKISEKFKFVRTDFYEIEGQLYFGEITFFPASGFEKFVPDGWDLKFGEMLNLR